MGKLVHTKCLTSDSLNIQLINLEPYFFSILVGNDWFVDQFDKILFDDVILDAPKNENILDVSDFKLTKIDPGTKKSSGNPIGVLSPFYAAPVNKKSNIFR